MFTPEAYRALLSDFGVAGYRYSSFEQFEPRGCLLLRHDVDFSLSDAADLAEIESEAGAFATYFILLSSDFYNPWSASSRAQLKRLQTCGGRIGLHFDPTAYADLDEGFACEKKTIEDLLGNSLSIVSLHRPRNFLEDNNRPLAGVRHTYEDAYFRDIAYISDSGGSFRYGHPLESEAFLRRATIHLNLHPIWWLRSGEGPSQKIRNWERPHFEHLNGEVVRNCATFDGRPFWDQP